MRFQQTRIPIYHNTNYIETWVIHQFNIQTQWIFYKWRFWNYLVKSLIITDITIFQYLSESYSKDSLFLRIFWTFFKKIEHITHFSLIQCTISKIRYEKYYIFCFPFIVCADSLFSYRERSVFRIYTNSSTLSMSNWAKFHKKFSNLPGNLNITIAESQNIHNFFVALKKVTKL